MMAHIHATGSAAGTSLQPSTSEPPTGLSYSALQKATLPEISRRLSTKGAGHNEVEWLAQDHTGKL